MNRLILAGFVLAAAACAPEPAPERAGTDLSGYRIVDLQQAMTDGNLTAREIVENYLDRIEALDRNGPKLNSIIELNPDAVQIADALDRERAAGGVRSPLHGIPVILKANIDTGDTMATTAGSLALAGHVAPDDAFLVARLREAGAVILGKANLSEWANFRSTNSSSGWSSLGGQTRNPYDPSRNPCGSSSGSAVAVAANLTVLAIGTETNGSIICPSGINGIVGIKPTLGLVSRDGIIPIAHTQDTAGPMARNVHDAALMLNVLAAKDPGDPATEGRPAQVPDYAAGLEAASLSGKRIGLLDVFDGEDHLIRTEEVFMRAVEVLEAQGAEIVGPIEIDTEGVGPSRYDVLLYEFKTDLNAYLAASAAPVKTLEDIIEFNEAHADAVMPIFGQDILVESQKKGPLTDTEYVEALETVRRAYRDGVDQALEEHQLDALLGPSNGPAWLTDHVNGDHFSVGTSSFAAVSGYASITVPAGFVSGLPVGVSIIGAPFSERTLIEIAYAFEQAMQARRPPQM